MKTRMVEEREGEWLGPVDWAYDFSKHASVAQWAKDGGIECLRAISESPKGWLYSPSGFSAFSVVEVGMYDGWPFWEPTPAIGYVGVLGGVEIAFYYDLAKHKLSRKP